MDRPFKIDHCKQDNAPWIVLINGLFAGLRSWDEHVEHLTHKFNVLRYDGPGQGDWRELETVPTLNEQVEVLSFHLNQLNIEKAILLGLSNGGRVALKFSELYPHRVKEVLAFDTYCELKTELKIKLESWLYASRAGGNDLRFKVSTPWIFGKTFLAEESEKILRFQKVNKMKSPILSEKLIESSLLGESIDLEKINVPISFYVGREDLLTPLSLHQEMQNRCQNASTHIIEGGHASILEYPQEMIKVMESL